MVDFHVSYDLFQRLTGFTSGDWDLYYIDSTGIRATTTVDSVELHSRDVETEISLREHIKNASLAWPTTGSGLLAWQDENMPLDLPAWFRPLVEAQDLSVARAILDVALKAAEGDRSRKVSVLLATPEKPANGHFIAKKQRDEASRKVRAVEGCIDAVQAAGEHRWKEELSATLRARGLAEVEIDYHDFLQLTTFDSSEEHPHTGDHGFYAYRRNAVGEVIGIATGPSIQQLGAGPPRRIAADHQRVASLNLPGRASAIAEWVFAQGGDVQLALPDTDELPKAPAQWVDAVAAIAVRQGGRFQAQQAANGEDSLPPRSEAQEKKKRGKGDDRLAAQMWELCKPIPDRDRTTSNLWNKLLESAGKQGSCVVRQDGNNLVWEYDGVTEKRITKRGLQTKLNRLLKRKGN